MAIIISLMTGEQSRVTFTRVIQAERLYTTRTVAKASGKDIPLT